MSLKRTNGIASFTPSHVPSSLKEHKNLSDLKVFHKRNTVNDSSNMLFPNKRKEKNKNFVCLQKILFKLKT